METSISAEGSCRCGAVRFRARLDPERGTVRCNCRYCTKTGWWGAMLMADQFTLVAGEDALGQPAEGAWDDRRPCGTCGVIPFARGQIPDGGGDFVVVNVRCLDGFDFEGLVVRHLDGKNDTWAELAVRRWRDPVLASST